MLNRLAEYAQRKGISSQPGFGDAKIHWILVLHRNGSPVALRRACITDSRRPEPKQFSQAPITPANVLNAGGKSHFLWESAAVVLNWPKKSADRNTANKIDQKHQFFQNLIREASAVDPSLHPVLAFYDNSEFVQTARNFAEQENARQDENLTFAVDDKTILEGSQWRNWWFAKSRSLQNTGQPAPHAAAPDLRALDFITAQPCVPEASHPTIRGLIGIGGQANTRLISYDKEAFESYGLKASANCAMSADSASLYTSVLQQLIWDSDRCSKLGNSLILHWFDADVEKSDDLFTFLLDPPETEEITALQRIRDLVRSVHAGDRPNLAGSRFFVLVIGASGGRIVVRRWLEGAFEELADNLTRWFDDLSIGSPHLDGKVTSHFSLFRLAGAASRPHATSNSEAPEKQRALDSELLLNSALLGRPLPHSFVQSVLARIKLDAVSSSETGKAPARSRPSWLLSHAPERIAILKLFLVRNQQRRTSPLMSDIQPSLNPQLPEPAYHCGRLMAVLAKIQQEALGDVGAGVIERYYAAASSTPALVFGRLIRGAQPHLSSLKPGLAWYYQELLGKITQAIGCRMPATLSLEDQSLFALGYYHQWLDLRTKRERPANEVTSETSSVNSKENN